MSFEPFDEEYSFDRSVLIEDFPIHLWPSVKKWIFDVLIKHKFFSGRVGMGQVLDDFLLPLNRELREGFRSNDQNFFIDIFSNVVKFRNVLSYMLQNVADMSEGNQLERILAEGSSAYAVEFEKGKKIKGLRNPNGEPIFQVLSMKLAYRVPLIVKTQAREVMNQETLLAEAWESHYGINCDDEKTVTRCTDAVAGLLRNEYFPTEKRPQLGTLLQKMRAKPKDYPLPAAALYNSDKFLELMEDFSKIRGNHKTGTGRAPTHEESGFVLHFSIMLFQLLRGRQK